MQLAQAYESDINMPDIRLIYEGKLLHLTQRPVVSEGKTHFPLRTIAEQNAAKVVWDENYKTAFVSYNGELISYSGIIENGCMLAPADFFESVFGIKTVFYPEFRTFGMSKDGHFPKAAQVKALLPSYDGYTKEDVEWLSKIVEAEARGESYSSKLAVANVIMNRVQSPNYPSTIKAVIFDKRHGVQFTPTKNGAVYNNPKTESFLAALDALEGRNNASTTLFFYNPQYATTNWISNNRQYAFTIGGHKYYY